MKTVASTLRLLSVLLLAVAPLAPAGCDEGGDDDGQTYACRYDYSTYSVSEYGSDYEEYPGNCTEVSSPEACDDITESDNECNGGFCSEWTYFNVDVQPGTCDAPAGAADDASNGGGGSGDTCQWPDDGECDEPEGTGYCAEGTDTADCGCPWTYDGECDEPEGTGYCAEGTDSADC